MIFKGDRVRFQTTGTDGRISGEGLVTGEPGDNAGFYVLERIDADDETSRVFVEDFDNELLVTDAEIEPVQRLAN